MASAFKRRAKTEIQAVIPIVAAHPFVVGIKKSIGREIADIKMGLPGQYYVVEIVHSAKGDFQKFGIMTQEEVERELELVEDEDEYVLSRAPRSLPDGKEPKVFKLNTP